MVLNAVRFGAKCSAFWCKMQCVLVLNARRFGAKCSANAAKCAAKSINIRRKWYKHNPFEL